MYCTYQVQEVQESRRACWCVCVSIYAVSDIACAMQSWLHGDAMVSSAFQAKARNVNDSVDSDAHHLLACVSQTQYEEPVSNRLSTFPNSVDFINTTHTCSNRLESLEPDVSSHPAILPIYRNI